VPTAVVSSLKGIDCIHVGIEPDVQWRLPKDKVSLIDSPSRRVSSTSAQC
jgi:hypothetical protein